MDDYKFEEIGDYETRFQRFSYSLNINPTFSKADQTPALQSAILACKKNSSDLESEEFLKGLEAIANIFKEYDLTRIPEEILRDLFHHLIALLSNFNFTIKLKIGKYFKLCLDVLENASKQPEASGYILIEEGFLSVAEKISNGTIMNWQAYFSQVLNILTNLCNYPPSKMKNIISRKQFISFPMITDQFQKKIQKYLINQENEQTFQEFKEDDQIIRYWEALKHKNQNQYKLDISLLKFLSAISNNKLSQSQIENIFKLSSILLKTDAPPEVQEYIIASLKNASNIELGNRVRPELHSYKTSELLWKSAGNEKIDEQICYYFGFLVGQKEKDLFNPIIIDFIQILNIISRDTIASSSAAWLISRIEAEVPTIIENSFDNVDDLLERLLLPLISEFETKRPKTKIYLGMTIALLCLNRLTPDQLLQLSKHQFVIACEPNPSILTIFAQTILLSPDIKIIEPIAKVLYKIFESANNNDCYDELYKIFDEEDGFDHLQEYVFENKELINANKPELLTLLEEFLTNTGHDL